MSLSLTTVCIWNLAWSLARVGAQSLCHKNDQCMVNQEVYVECILYFQNPFAANSHMSPLQKTI